MGFLHPLPARHGPVLAQSRRGALSVACGGSGTAQYKSTGLMVSPDSESAKAVLMSENP